MPTTYRVAATGRRTGHTMNFDYVARTPDRELQAYDRATGYAIRLRQRGYTVTVTRIDTDAINARPVCPECDTRSCSRGPGWPYCYGGHR